MARQYALRVRDNFRESIAELGLTMEQFAERSGTPRITIVKALARGTLRPLTAKKLAKTYAELAGLTPERAADALFLSPPRTLTG